MKTVHFSRSTAPRSKYSWGAIGVLFFVLAGAARGEPLTLIFAGDILLDDGPGRTIAAGGDPLAPFSAILAQADYRIGNLECPVASGGQPLPAKIITFRACLSYTSRCV